MIAVAVRQHRIQLSSGLGVLVVLAALLVWTGHEMTSYLRSSGLAACLAAHGGGCDSFSRLFESRYGSLLSDIAWLNFLPMLVGVFWGAPLVARELETGTYRLAWTQSITRRRWLSTKLAIFVLATIAIAGGFSLLLGWWFHPFAQLEFQGGYSRMDMDSFDFQGIVPIAYSLFAFAVGAAAGVIVRRVLPAMAITFAVYLPLRLWMQNLRAHFEAPLHVAYQAFGTSPRAGLGDWVLQSRVVNSAGRAISDQTVLSTCGTGASAGKVDPNPVPDLARLPPARCLPARVALLGLPGHRIRHLRWPGRPPARARLLLGNPSLDDLRVRLGYPTTSEPSRLACEKLRAWSTGLQRGALRRCELALGVHAIVACVRTMEVPTVTRYAR